jgi:primosomal protein N' (replication factor Y)
MAAVSGTPAGVADLLHHLDLPDGAEVIGTVQLDADSERALVRLPRREGVELAHALKTAAALRSARKASDPVRIVVDPVELG